MSSAGTSIYHGGGKLDSDNFRPHNFKFNFNKHSFMYDVSPNCSKNLILSGHDAKTRNLIGAHRSHLMNEITMNLKDKPMLNKEHAKNYLPVWDCPRNLLFSNIFRASLVPLKNKENFNINLIVSIGLVGASFMFGCGEIYMTLQAILSASDVLLNLNGESGLFDVGCGLDGYLKSYQSQT